MWKRLIIFVVAVILLMAIISSIHARNQVVPVMGEASLPDVPPKAAHDKGLAVTRRGEFLVNESGHPLYWNHPGKYFCQDGYLRGKKNQDKIQTKGGSPVHKDNLLKPPEKALFEELIHELLIPTPEE